MITNLDGLALSGSLGFKLHRLLHIWLRHKEPHVAFLIHLLDRRESGFLLLALIPFGQHSLRFLSDQALKTEFGFLSFYFH